MAAGNWFISPPQPPQASTLEPFGNDHFLFTRQKGYKAHLSQVDADRIAGLFRRRGSLVEFRIFAGRGFLLRPDIRLFGNVGGGVRQLGVGSVFIQRDAFALEGGKRAVNFFVCMLFGGERVVHLIVKQIPLFFAQFNEQPDLILLFLNFP